MKKVGLRRGNELYLDARSVSCSTYSGGRPRTSMRALVARRLGIEQHRHPAIGADQRLARAADVAGFRAVFDAARTRHAVVGDFHIDAIAVELAEHAVLRARPAEFVVPGNPPKLESAVPANMLAAAPDDRPHGRFHQAIVLLCSLLLRSVTSVSSNL